MFSARSIIGLVRLPRYSLRSATTWFHARKKKMPPYIPGALDKSIVLKIVSLHATSQSQFLEGIRRNGKNPLCRNRLDNVTRVPRFQHIQNSCNLHITFFDNFPNAANGTKYCRVSVLQNNCSHAYFLAILICTYSVRYKFVTNANKNLLEKNLIDWTLLGGKTIKGRATSVNILFSQTWGRKYGPSCAPSSRILFAALLSTLKNAWTTQPGPEALRLFCYPVSSGISLAFP